MSQVIIKSITQPVYIYDKESLRFLDANDSALKLYGYSLDEFMQMDVTDLYTPEDIQTLLDSSVETFKEGEFSKPYKHRKKDGNYADVKINRINYKYNDTEAYLNILEDVSKSSELEKEKQIFRTAFQNSSDMIIVTDAEGIITFANEPASRNLGIASQELITRLLTTLCNGEDQLFLNNSVFQSHIKETSTFTIQLQASDGNFIECDMVSTPIFDSNNSVDSFVFVAKVIPEPVSESENIKEAVEAPIQEVSDNKSELGASDLAFKTNNSLNGIFHEILTPLNVILGFTQEISESIENPSPEQKEAIEIINQNRFSLLSLMNSIIEYSDSQSNASGTELTEISITDIIDYCDKNITEITGAKDFEFAYGKISSSIKFLADKKQFLTLINNLFRLITRISTQKKLYFSAYPAGSDNFNISISDGFGKSSAPLIETLKLLITEKKDPKLFGLSKFYPQIITDLLNKLNGQLVVVNENSAKADIAFAFPLRIPEENPAAKLNDEEKVDFQDKDFEIEENITVDEPLDSNINEEVEIEVLDEEVTKDEEILPPDEEIKQEQEVPAELNIEEQVSKEAEPITKKTVASINTNGLSSLRCLYIEDQVDSQILFKVQMKDLKNIQFAASFEEALPLLESNEFDFIIMDINLQGEYNGLDALKVINQMPRFENIPVIAVTAYVLPGDREKFIATGFTDFISKPIFREKLLESLKKIFVN